MPSNTRRLIDKSITVGEAYNILAHEHFDADEIARISAGLQEPNPKQRRYIEALNTVAEYESTHELPTFTAHEYTVCNRCKGKGVIESYKNVEGGKCFKCNGRGYLFIAYQYEK